MLCAEACAAYGECTFEQLRRGRKISTTRIHSTKRLEHSRLRERFSYELLGSGDAATKKICRAERIQTSFRWVTRLEQAHEERGDRF
jgi:hypothetical protein